MSQVIDISRDRLDEAAEVLSIAFDNYPMMRYFFAGGGEHQAEHVREAFRFTCVMRLELGGHLIGICEDERLVGVACINQPESAEWPASLEQEYERFQQLIGPQAVERFGKYGELGEKFAVGEPHFYLVAIGVRPEAQGKGYGKILLDETQRLSQSHPTSTGVALDTETESNVALYQHCGYEVTAQSNLDEIPIWFLFRRNDS
jgi:ribosomal protein S18 acetylase RimI-like enzyme